MGARPFSSVSSLPFFKSLFPLLSVSLPVVSLEKMPCLNQSESPSHVRLSNSSPSSLKAPPFAPSPSQRCSEKQLNGRGGGAEASTPRPAASPSSLNGRPSPARSPLDRKPPSTPSPSPQDRKASQSPSPSHRSGALQVLEKRHQNGTKSSSRSQKRLSGQCGDQPSPPSPPLSVLRALTCPLVVHVIRPDPASPPPPLPLLLSSSLHLTKLRAFDFHPLVHRLPLPEKAASLRAISPSHTSVSLHPLTLYLLLQPLHTLLLRPHYFLPFTNLFL